MAHPPPPAPREVFHIAGNRPDPVRGRAPDGMPGSGGQVLRGLEATHDLTAGALGHPQVLTPFRLPVNQNGQRDDGVQIIEPDVFEDHIHLHCPQCLAEGRGEVGLRIRKGAKAWQFDPLRDPPLWPGYAKDQLAVMFPQGLGGTLDVEPFRCTWETQGDLKRGFGLQKCGLFVSIRNNVMVRER